MGGFRHILFKVVDTSIIKEFGSKEAAFRCVTNNHLIPANKSVKNKIEKINVDEYVCITGYLVNAKWQLGNRIYTLNSSTSREDTANGACEIILVEDVKWIK